MEQPEYNIFNRKKVDKEFARLYEDIGLGLRSWSPLASGLLTGKYIDGVPEGSRASTSGLRVVDRECVTNTERNRRGEGPERGRGTKSVCTLSQLALAWCAHNKNVSTVITGASRCRAGAREHEGAQTSYRPQRLRGHGAH